MKKLVLMLFASLIIVSCGKEEVVEDSKPEAKLVEIKSLTEFESTIKTGVSFMFFHATWCSICKAQRPNILGLLSDSALSKVKFGEVDKDQSKQILDKYPVAGQPVMIIYKDNVEKERLSGVHTKEHMTELLKKLNP